MWGKKKGSKGGRIDIGGILFIFKFFFIVRFFFFVRKARFSTLIYLKRMEGGKWGVFCEGNNEKKKEKSFFA